MKSSINTLIEAASKGDIKQVEELIKLGAELNAADVFDRTALMFASSNKHVDVIKALIDAGADLDAQDEWGHTALMVASFAEHVDVVKALIDAGADFDAQDEYGRTALMQAIFKNNVEIAEVLINAGADIEIQDKAGFTALKLAAIANNVEIIKKLLEAGAEINAIGKDGLTALTAAAFTGSLEAAIALVEAGAKFNAHKNADYFNALKCIPYYRCRQTFKTLLEAGAGADVIASDYFSQTILTCKECYSNTEILRSYIYSRRGVDSIEISKMCEQIASYYGGHGKPEALKAVFDEASLSIAQSISDNTKSATHFDILDIIMYTPSGISNSIVAQNILKESFNAHSDAFAKVSDDAVQGVCTILKSQKEPGSKGL